MSGNFVFPPPPPPPPPSSGTQYGSGIDRGNPATNWASRGRGGHRGNSSRGHDRRGGHGFGRGDQSGQRSSYSYQQRNGFRDDSIRDGQQSMTSRSPDSRSTSSSYSIAQNACPTNDAFVGYGERGGLKRPHQQAFPRNGSIVKTQTAPSVPSFGSVLPFAPGLPKAVTGQPSSHSLNKPKSLGLVPVTEDDSASDEDEEIKLAAIQGQSSALSFSYRGKLSTLRTQEDIAAWIAERRRNFPSAARREVMAKKKEEDRLKVAEARQIAKKKIEETRQRKDFKQPKQPRLKSKETMIAEKTDGSTAAPAVNSKSKQELKLEKLRKVMEKNAKKIAKLEAATRKANPKEGLETARNPSSADIDHGNDDSAGEDSSTVSSFSDDESTSSSGSSSSEDDDDSTADGLAEIVDLAGAEMVAKALSESESESEAPQEMTSTQKGPIRVAPPDRNKQDNLPFCRNVKKYGKCSRKFCKFRHQSKTEGRHTRSGTKSVKAPERLSLYQRLLKQQIKEDEQAAAEENRAKENDAKGTQADPKQVVSEQQDEGFDC